MTALWSHPLSLPTQYKGAEVESGRQTQVKKPRMVHSKSHSRIWNLTGGQCGMEIAVLLLLTVSLTAATPLRSTPRSDDVLSAEAVQTSGVRKDTEEQHAQALGVILLPSEDKPLNLDALKRSMAAKLRPRRGSPMGGCKFGTCHVHNLAHTLYHIGQKNGKDESTKAQDPAGFGR